jgi:hypothetical protein
VTTSACTPTPRAGIVKSWKAAYLPEGEKYLRAWSQSSATIRLIAAWCAPINARANS